MKPRLAIPTDTAALAAIYNQGIEERTATFETALCSDETILTWFDGMHPIVVVTDDADEVIAFARTSAYSPRACYRGVFEFAVYTDFAHRRQGAGLLALRELVTHARTAGAWKLLSRIFVDNEPSRMLVASLGFREVGVHHRHAKLDGRWRDVVVVEKFLAPIGSEASIPPPLPQARAPRDLALASLRGEGAAVRLSALEPARALIATQRAADQELLDAMADACFAAKLSDSNTRARFVEAFREYAAISRDAARSVDTALFTRLGHLSITLDIDAFYEATFVIKQIVVVTGDAGRAADLAMHRPQLLTLMKEAILLPKNMRGRISPGNVASLLMTLALAGCESEDDKRQVADLATEARERHRVEPPVSVRPPSFVPPPPPPEVVHVVQEVAQEVTEVTQEVPVDEPPPAISEKKPRKRRVADPTKPPKKRTRAKKKAEG